MDFLLNNGTLIPIAFLWLIGCYVAASAGRTKGLGFFEVFFISALLSPITGLLYVSATADLKEDEYREKILKYISRQQEQKILSTEGQARLKELEADMTAEKITVSDFFREKSKLS